MTPTDPASAIPTPDHLLLSNFLATPQHQQLLGLVLDRREAFSPANTAGELLGYRRAMKAPLPAAMIDWFAGPLRQGKDDWCRQLGLPPLTIARIEMELVAYNHGHGYFMHRDIAGRTQDRCLSFVYLFFRQPQAFSGGELLMFGPQLTEDVEPNPVVPRDNALIVFPSHYFHEVASVNCPSGAFEDSRFAVVGFASGSFHRC